MAYRCFVCDNPAGTHHSDCMMREDDKDDGVRDPWWSADTDQKINVASGEDVVIA